MSRHVRVVVEVPAGLRSRDALFDTLEATLGFPGYFGRNWDALYDVLSDFGWHSQVDALKQVTIRHRDRLERLPMKQRDAYRELLLDVVEALSEREGAPRFAFSFPCHTLG